MVSPAHAAFWRLRPIIVSSTTMKSFFKLSHSSHLARESSFIISWTALVQNSNFCSCILWRVRLAPGTCASLCVRPCNLARHSVAGDNLNNGSEWQTLIYTHRNFLPIIVSLKIDDTRETDGFVSFVSESWKPETVLYQNRTHPFSLPFLLRGRVHLHHRLTFSFSRHCVGS